MNIVKAAKQFGIDYKELYNILMKRCIDLDVKLMKPSNLLELVEIDDKAIELIQKEISRHTERIEDMEYLLSIRKESIVDTKSNLVYFLFNDDYLIYIGMTSNFKLRMQAHMKDKEFNFISYIEFDRHDVIFMEALYINTYHTPLNRNVYPMKVIMKMIIERIDFT